LAWFAIPIAVVKHVVDAAREGDASSKARILAENISEGINCTAPLVLATPVATAVWVISVLQVRKAKREPKH